MMLHASVLYQTSIHGVHINLQDLVGSKMMDDEDCKSKRAASGFTAHSTWLRLHVFHIGAVVFQKLSDVVRLGLLEKGRS
jgi:hypothetical protein